MYTEGNRQMDRDFMREGEPLFDWEKVVIEKRRKMITKQPAFDDQIEEEVRSLKNMAANRGLIDWFRDLLDKREGK